MAELEILHGPEEKQLLGALKHRRHQHQIYFRMSSPGSFNSSRLYFYVDGLEYQTDLVDTWRLTLTPVGSGKRLVGLYSTASHQGWLDTEVISISLSAPISFLRVSNDIKEILIAAEVKTLTDLVAKDEFAVCQIFVQDILSYGFGISNAIVIRAIQHFMELRICMDAFGIGFAGRRHNQIELYLKFEAQRAF